MKPRTFKLENPKQLAQCCGVIAKLSEFPLEIIARDYVPKRSSAQNRRLWKLHGLAAEVVGCTADQMHEDMLCEIFGYDQVQMPSGDLRRIPLKRSSERNKKEFMEFLDRVESFYASELGVWLGQDE